MSRDRDFEQSIYSNLAAATPPPAGGLFDTYADSVLRHVDDVLTGRDCPWPLPEESKAFLRHLRARQGKENAIALGELCERVHINPRKGKECVQNLRQFFGVQICASRGADDGGYFLAATAAESFDSTKLMVNQAITMLRVAHKMRGGSHHIEQLLQQLELDLTKEPS